MSMENKDTQEDILTEQWAYYWWIMSKEDFEIVSLYQDNISSLFIDCQVDYYSIRHEFQIF